MGDEPPHSSGAFAYSRGSAVGWHVVGQSIGLRIDGSPPVASSVPEPETYTMLLAGLGLMGFMARRRKNVAA